MYPLQDIVNEAFTLEGVEAAGIGATPPPSNVGSNSIAALLHSLHLGRPLQVLGSELLRLFQVESVQPATTVGARELPFVSAPLDVFKRVAQSDRGRSGDSSSSGKVLATPQSLAVNAADPRMLAIATSQGIREINVQHALIYRRRNRDNAFEDEEAASWAAGLHGFDTQEPGYLPSTTAAGRLNNEPQSPPTRALDASVQYLQQLSSNPYTTSLAAPAPKAVLAAILGGLLTPSSSALMPSVGLGVTSKVASLLGLTSSHTSHASSAFLQGGMARIYEGFVVGSAAQRAELAGNASQYSPERDVLATQLSAHPSLPMCQSHCSKQVARCVVCCAMLTLCSALLHASVAQMCLSPAPVVCFCGTSAGRHLWLSFPHAPPTTCCTPGWGIPLQRTAPRPPRPPRARS